MQGGNSAVLPELLGHLMVTSNACPRIRRFEPCNGKGSDKMSLPSLGDLAGRELSTLGGAEFLESCSNTSQLCS